MSLKYCFTAASFPINVWGNVSVPTSPNTLRRGVEGGGLEGGGVEGWRVEGWWMVRSSSDIQEGGKLVGGGWSVGGWRVEC